MPSKKRGSLSGLAPSEFAARLLSDDTDKALTVVPSENVAPEPAIGKPAIKKPSVGQPSVGQPSVGQLLAPKRGYMIQSSGRVVRRITLGLPEVLGKQLSAYAAEQSRTQADIVAEALVSYYGWS